MSLDAQRLKEIFLSAAQIASRSDRALFLERACGHDAELRQKVEALLHAPDASGSFLAPAPTGDHKHDEDASAHGEGGETVGAIIGPYKLLQKLGEGGMGAVWVAEQHQPVKRRVAVKVIKPGMDTRAVIARFEAERQALAMMDHPGIAKVLDAGATDNGRPYFVMELVKGIPITKFCDQEHLTPRERLELFVQVCQAVQHAHQKGIIHRDLKPSNVLIALYDGKPVPKIIDFGVAKATTQKLTDRTVFTEVGQIVGTVEYMAPEQAELNNLDIDTRADIYSLGVLLYELLTGAPPFTARQLRNAAFTDMLKIIRESEPPKPSTKVSSSAELPAIAAKRKLEPAKLTKLLRGDLDWIVMKCLEKERNRRYETANGLAMDVQRYLNDEPVLASPPTLRYRLRKYWRRHRGALLAAGVIVLVLIGGMIGTSVGLLQAERSRSIAEAKEREALDEKARAVASQKQAMEALRATTDDVVEQLIGGKPVLGPAEKAFLEKTLKRWQAFADTAGEGEQARAIRAEGMYRVAKLRANLGQRDEAVIGYREAIALRRKLVEDYPGVPQHRQDLALTYDRISYEFGNLGKQQERETALRQALALREKLVADFPDEPEFRFDEAWSHHDLGWLLQNQGKYVEAELSYRRALAIYDQLIDASHKVASNRRDMAITHYSLGNLLQAQYKCAEAEAAHRQVIALMEKLVEEYPAVPDYREVLSKGQHSLGKALYCLGKLREAEAAYRAALLIQEKLAADFPAVPNYRGNLASQYINLGWTLCQQGKQEAETVLRQALALAEKLVADFPTVPEYRGTLGATESNLGAVILIVKKEPEKALPWCDKAIATLEEALRRGGSIDRIHPRLIDAHANRAEALSALLRHGEAVKEYDKAVELANEPRRSVCRSLRAGCRVRAGQVAAAIEEAEEVAKNADSLVLYNVACVYALASVPTKANPISPEQQAKYAERAIALLHQAVAKGYKDVRNMKNDEDLKSLRQRDDFKKLLSEMQQ
jgi:serine/threonine protein kinase